MTDIRTRLTDAIFTETTQIVFADTGPDVEKRVAAIMSMSAQQLADVLLSLPGIAIVELPEPDKTDEDRTWWRHAPYDPTATPRWPGYNVIREGDEVAYGGDNYLPEEARAFAAALLAAANAAEADQ